MKQIVPGSRFYRFAVDKDNNPSSLEIIKVLGYKNEDRLRVRRIRYMGKDVNSKQTYTIDKNLLVQEYTLLQPDGFVAFNIVELHVGVDKSNTVEDVVITLHKSNSLAAGDHEPYCVCRQNVINVFSTMIMRHENDYEVGMTMSLESTPPDVDFKMMTAADKMLKCMNIAVYLDNSLDDIIECMKAREMGEYNKVLVNLRNHYINSIPFEYRMEASREKIYKGYCTNIVDLLNHTEFMYDFNRAFYVTRIDKLQTQGNIIYNEDEPIMSFKGTVSDDSIAITNSAVAELEKVFSKKMDNIVFIKYDRDIDLNQIRRDKLLIKDNNNNTYVCIYDEVNNN